MKNIIYIICSVFMACLLITCKEKTNHFSIEGKVANAETKNIYVVYVDTSKGFQTDTILLNKNGYFKMDGAIDSIGVVTLLLNRSEWTSVFVRSGDDIKISADASYIEIAEIKGGKLNKELNQFKQGIKNILIEKNEIDKAITEAYIEEEMDWAIIETLEPKLANLNHSINIVAEQYIKEHPASLVSVVIMLDYLYKKESMDKLNNLLPILEEPAKSFYLTKYLQEMSDGFQRVKVGKRAPDFTLQDTTLNKNISLVDFKGKNVLVHFWDSRDQMSRVNNQYELSNIYLENKKKRQFAMIGVSLDHNINDWKKAITTDYMPWVHASDLKGLNSEIAHTYGVVSIPTNFLIDTQGVIIGQNVKLDDIKRLLPNLN